MYSNDTTTGLYDAARLTFCPCCGSDDYASNLLDEAPYIEAAQAAPMLRWFGANQLAAELLHRLATVQIANFLRPRWLCLVCGVAFHG
ncbi:MAG: hypothetical protein LBF16_03410 [Pseudomonadales bacterium]|jgi:hypothetical protein|nr:hypothetical protein [Pseudomonadales bacterium]